MTATVDRTAGKPYDRLAELKAFDEMKAGVKELMDTGITEIPRIFHMPPHLLDEGPSFSPDDPDFIFPVIDLQGSGAGQLHDLEKRKRIVEKIREASETWGFFQIVNHGVPANILERMSAATRGFFEEKVEHKRKYFGFDVAKKVNYTSNFDLYNQPFAIWGDAILYHMTPDPPSPEEIPACTREIVPEFTEEMVNLGELLFELLSESLGLPSNHLKEMDCMEVLGLAGNYYPACPQPKLTLGSVQHADLYFLTVILQDQIGGLQVRRKNHWVDVPFVPGGLVVNVGDMLQLISNDKFKSVVHRVRVKSQGPRVSVAAFFGHSSSTSTRMYGPIKELLSEDNPPKYQEITLREFFTRSYQKGFDGNSLLPQLKL